MLIVSECVAKAALEREESRGGHTRDDFPEMSPKWRKVNLICSLTEDGGVDLVHQPIPPMRPGPAGAVRARSELKKYFTDAELEVLDTPEGSPDIPEQAKTEAQPEERR